MLLLWINAALHRLMVKEQDISTPIPYNCLSYTPLSFIVLRGVSANYSRKYVGIPEMVWVIGLSGLGRKEISPQKGDCGRLQSPF